ncbi:MAG: hypothetical protein P4L69_15585 [Desulfosporosinus sp.]|nr:hypothetical protein [Desulfosporosinus sp.]
MAEQFDSDDEGVVEPKKRTMAPNVNPLTAMRTVSRKRIFIDSRDRDRTHYPNANHFQMSMTVPLKAVKSITLTNAKIPLVNGVEYVAILLKNIKDRTLHLPTESPGFGPGVVAIIPLVPHSDLYLFALYSSQTGQQSGGSAGGWRIEFPQGLAKLSKLQIELYTWGWDAVGLKSTCIPLALTAEANLAVMPSVANNISLQFEIEHDLQ